MSESASISANMPHRTQPIGLLVSAISILRQMVFPLIAGVFALREEFSGAMLVIIPLIGVAILSFGIAYLSWLRRTFTVGEEDIRVESGIISRTAASVPYERIQDVSLEASLLPRMFGLVSVKFETGAGGADELKLAYLTEDQGEHLRQVIRERRADEVATVAASADGSEVAATDEPSETLFTMGTGRLLTFGLFEFSLAVFAILFGLASQFENFLPFDIWDADFWTENLSGQRDQFEGLSYAAQVASGVFALGSLIVLGFATGVVKVFTREWDFRLEQTARGFRRRRGMFTKTDVIMPTHRVQAVKLGTRWLRYRFGWHGLKFVSLASDFGGSSHVVAPFAKRAETDLIIRAAGFEPPHEGLEWHRACARYRFDSIFFDALLIALVAVPVGIFAPIGFIAIPLGLALISVALNLYAWAFHRYAVEGGQIFSAHGLLSPATEIVTKIKLHSVEISQGPLSQLGNYATLKLGLAGGSFSISGLPLERARELQSEIANAIGQADFSEINKG
jgi:putative membrane protein